MNSLIENLNQWGGSFLDFAWPMLWQSSLLMVIVFAVDFLFRRKIRASIRYALWLVVLVKLCLPPTLALPTSAAWWLFPARAVDKLPAIPKYTVTYDMTAPSAHSVRQTIPARPPMPPKLNGDGWALLASGTVSVGLLLSLAFRWWQISRNVRRATASEKFADLLEEASFRAGLRSRARLKLVDTQMPPAVCGLFRPVILLPQALVEKLSATQLRAVLLHEAFHLRRKDVWVNCAQALLQIVYWWHPLLWLANARIRRLREEAVDDAVMLALHGEAETYAPMLLEVAKLAFGRPLMSLGLVGIMESRSALRQRIERLVDFHPPRKAGLTLVSFFGILAFTAVAAPMGGAPAQKTDPTLAGGSDNLNQTNSTVSTPAGIASPANAAQNPVTMTFRINQTIRSDDLKKSLIAVGVTMPPTFLFLTGDGILLAHGSKEQLALMRRVVLQLNGCPTNEIADGGKQFVKQTGTLGFEDTSATNLFMRSFRVDAHVFPGALRSIPDLQTNTVSMMARSLFSKLGVDWETPKGKWVFFNDRPGLLFVKATESDLDTIERVLSALNNTAPQIHIKARFLRVPEEETQALEKIPGFSNGVTTVLVDTDARALLEAIKRNPGSEILAEPEAVTLSGRQVRMLSTQFIDVVTNFALRETALNSAVVPEAETLDVGPVFDTIATVLSDGYTIELKPTTSSTEFLGYAAPTNLSARFATNSAGERMRLPTVLPAVEISRASAHLKIYDNQSLVLFPKPERMLFSQPDYERDKRVAEHIQQAEGETKDKTLIVLITATLVDEAGNRIHSDEEMPFAQHGIPPQPPQSK